MRFFLLFSFIVLIAAPVQAAGGDTVLDIIEVESQSGLKAWLVEDHSIPVIALKFSFRGAGAANDPPEKQGLSRMAANTMDEGAGKLDSQAFQKDLQDMVAELHFNSGRDHFGGEVKTLTRNSDRVFALLRMALMSPRFDDEPVARMREANKSRIRSAMADPEWVAARIQNDVIYAGHPYAMNSGGTLSTLDNITVEDLRTFARNLGRDRLVVAAAGDITPEDLSLLLDEVFGALPAQSQITEVADIALQNKGKTYIYKRDIPQTIVEIIQPGIDRHDPDFLTAQVMNYTLGAAGFGSRLTKQVREMRGLTYGIYTYLMDLDHADGLAITTSTKNESVKEILDLIRGEWNAMKTAPVTDAELSSAKSYLVGSLPLSLTSTEQIASVIHSLQMDDMPIDYLDRRKAQIETTTAADVARVAEKLLDADAFVTVLVGQPGDIKDAHIIETLPNVE